jgi:phosphohistidine phosphatase
MPELLLLRHAKSDRQGRRLGDFDRPLAARGRRAAPLIGRYLAAEGLEPDLVLCSTARRAVETLELLLTALASAPEIGYLKTLYLAPPSRLLAVLRRQGPDRGRILLVAHNPGLHNLAVALAGQGGRGGHGGSGEAARLLAEKFPTAALARFQVDGWPELGRGPARLLAFVRPRDLAADGED